MRSTTKQVPSTISTCMKQTDNMKEGHSDLGQAAAVSPWRLAGHKLTMDRIRLPHGSMTTELGVI